MSAPLVCHEGAVAWSTQPCHEVTVCGPVRGKPLTETLSPGGTVANVTSTFLGSRSRATVPRPR